MYELMNRSGSSALARSNRQYPSLNDDLEAKRGNKIVEIKTPVLITICCLFAVCKPYSEEQGFLNTPLLEKSPQEKLRHLLAPYDVVSLNYLAANYTENLIDKRVNVSEFTHLDSDVNWWDAYHLSYPDDTGRLIEGLAFEDQYSPVVRLELIRRFTRGIVAAKHPGTYALYAFRNKLSTKCHFMLNDNRADHKGGVLLGDWADSLAGFFTVGFEASFEKETGDLQVVKAGDFEFSDTPVEAGKHGTEVIRSSRYNNESPFVFNRTYQQGGHQVDFRGRYWLSDENLPAEFLYTSKEAKKIQIQIGGNKSDDMGLFSRAPGKESFIYLPDRTMAANSSEEEFFAVEKPAYNYLVLRREGAAFAMPGYSSALLVVWDGTPDEVRVEKDEKGTFGKILISYSATEGECVARLRLFPFEHINHHDMNWVYGNAESILENGHVNLNGYPASWVMNSTGLGLASGAYVLAKYNDPYFRTAYLHACDVTDDVLNNWERGMIYGRIWFPLKAMCWLVKAADLTGDKEASAKYKPWISKIADTMLSERYGYDGAGWPGGYNHFNSMKALWLVHEVTGQKKYLDAYERAFTVYNINKSGVISRNGTPLKTQAGMDTYFGSLPLAVWGHGGETKEYYPLIERLLTSKEPAGSREAVGRTVSDMFHDGGTGPWFCPDSNADFLGSALGGAGIPVSKKYVTAIGDFPIYNRKGEVTFVRKPFFKSPYFPTTSSKTEVLDPGRQRTVAAPKTVSFKPGSDADLFFAQSKWQKEGLIGNGQSMLYKFNIRNATAALVELTLKSKNGYRIEISPDGKQWFERANTWSAVDRRIPVDLAPLCNNSDELLRILDCCPARDASAVVLQRGQRIEREYYTYISDEGSCTYRFKFPGIKECFFDFLVGNGYKIEFSKDGKSWTPVINAAEKQVRIPGETGSEYFNNLAGQKDAGWIASADATPFIGDEGVVYIRFSSNHENGTYDGQDPFIRRIKAYGRYTVDDAWMRISRPSFGDPQGEDIRISEIKVSRWK